MFFGNNFTAYGITEMPINVYDTPGFFDSNDCQIDNNKRQIASQIGNKIDVFAYFMDSHNARINANIQKIFNRLNDWTMGKIWRNLVIVYPRFTRSISKLLKLFHTKNIRPQIK